MKQTRHPRTPPALRTLAMLLACCGSPLAQAQVIADPTAPANQRPTILRDNAGRPLVNIQTPSAAGVSRNTYRQFDVGSTGLVLNNARASNPWLAKGEASLILNEINSSNPSYLNGPITVAGRNAEVVIANPSGLSINGLSFINASRVTLTTGSPVLKNGALDGFNVQKGKVDIGTRGLNTGSANYTAILARSVVLNGRLDARDLSITTGAQNVSYASGDITPLAGSGAKPAIAIDSTALGGMYAGKITLLSTEAGVGVRNAGTLAATGQLVITAEGKLENSGNLRGATVSAATVSGDVNNSGSVQASQLLMLSAGNDLNLSGVGLKQNATTGPALMLSAKNNLTLAGKTTISTSRGGSISLKAGNIFSAPDGSTLLADGRITLEADVASIWNSTLTSTSGDVLARGARELSLIYAEVAAKNIQISGGAPFASGRARISLTATTLMASEDINLLAAGSLSMYRANFQGRNIEMSGGDVSAAEDSSTYNASGNMTVRAADTLRFYGGARTKDGTYIQNVNAGGNLLFTAKKSSSGAET